MNKCSKISSQSQTVLLSSELYHPKTFARGFELFYAQLRAGHENCLPNKFLVIVFLEYQHLMFYCPALLSMNFILLINTGMPKTVGILIPIRRIKIYNLGPYP